jgi:hypothetical protein
VTARSVRAGFLAGAALGAFYVTIIVWASGLDHLADQAAADWPYLVAMIDVHARTSRAIAADASVILSAASLPPSVTASATQCER